MTFTKHVIQRFQERVTSESSEVIRFFIESDIQASTFLYRSKNIEKRKCNGIIYVLDCTQKDNPIVVTLYLSK